MMESSVGKVVAVKPPGVTIDVEAVPFCRRCASGRGCGAGLLIGDDGKRRIEVPLPEGFQLSPGDQVILELGSRNLLRAATLAYGLPLAATIVTLMIGSVVAGPLADSTAVLLAAAGLAVGIGISRWQLAGSCRNNFVPEIRAICPNGRANCESRHE